MSDTPQNVYTEAQHFALLESAIERETAQLAGEKQSLEAQVETLTSEKAAQAGELGELKAKVDVLEAEKAAAEAKAEAAAQEFTDFKAQLAREQEIAEKKATRMQRIKAANSALGEDYFTTERAQRWAEMSDETFEALVADLTEAAASKPAQTPGDQNSAELAKESAAFAGGQAPKSTTDGSTLTTLLGARRGRRLTA